MNSLDRIPMFVRLLGRWLAESQRTARPGRPAFGGFDGQTTPAAVGRFKLGTLKMNDIYFCGEMPNVCLFGKLSHLPSRKGMELGKEGSSGSSRSPPTKKTGVARGPTDHSVTGDHSRIWVEKTCVAKL